MAEQREQIEMSKVIAKSMAEAMQHCNPDNGRDAQLRMEETQ